MKKWTKNEKKWKNKKQEKRQKNGRKKKLEKKVKDGPKGLPPEMGPKIDFSHKICQEKS